MKSGKKHSDKKNIASITELVEKHSDYNLGSIKQMIFHPFCMQNISLGKKNKTKRNLAVNLICHHQIKK